MGGNKHYAIIVLLIIIILILWMQDSKSPRVTLYYKPECPWCKKIMPYWNQAKKKYGDMLKFEEKNENFWPTPGITAVPSVVMKHGDHTHQYDHQYAQGHLESWLSQTLKIPPM